MNRRITFYCTFLLMIASMFNALGNYQNTYATSTFSGLSNGTLTSNLNGTLTMLTPINDEVDNTKSNDLKDCANCIGSDDLNPGTTSPLISNDNPNENDIGISGNDGGSNDNPNENDVSGDSPFSLPFNSQFADPSDVVEDDKEDISDKIPFP